MKDKNKKNRINKKIKIISVIISICLIFIIGTIVYFLYFSSSAKEKRNIKKLTKEMEVMGSDFYENYLYPQLDKQSNDKETLAKVLALYKDIGFKADLDTLSTYNDKINSSKIEQFINHKTKKACNRLNTIVTIFPKEAYGKTDYTLKVELDCGYDK